MVSWIGTREFGQWIWYRSRKLGIQPAQTGFRRPQQIVMTEMLTGDLGRDEYPIADPADGLRDHVLGPVHLRGIDKVGAQFDSPAQRFHPAAISPYADPDFRHHHTGVAELL